MHEIEPYLNWLKYYSPTHDAQSPFYRKTYKLRYENHIYGYYIHPLWDYIGSETLYVKVLFVDYQHRVAIIELLGEWNDALHNDIMYFKRTVIDKMLKKNINQFILIGENVMDFHASDDCYYEEWFEEIEDGWIAAINFRDFIQAEWRKHRLDYYLNFGGSLEIENWRTFQPLQLFEFVRKQIMKRLAM
ncbi:MAG: hypothetical protein NZ551_11200 [Microscillaceae bacterium]|nr:hypothetical protein [Microscillaceae bacterium]MDW8461763.1 hypothetical protein [Cytophagales bacterium]